MRKIFLLLCVSTILLRCNSSNDAEDDAKKIEEERLVNLANEAMAEYEAELNNEAIKNTDEINSTTIINATTTKYVFVVFKLEKEEVDLPRPIKWDGNSPPDVQYRKPFKTVTYYYTSGIITVDQFDEEIKYKLMDNIQASPEFKSKTITNTKIINRDCLEFDTYSEASKAREKYFVN